MAIKDIIIKYKGNIREMAFRMYEMMEKEKIYDILQRLCEEGVIDRDTYDRLVDYLIKFEICDVFGFDKSIVNTEDDVSSLYGLLSDLKEGGIMR